MTTPSATATSPPSNCRLPANFVADADTDHAKVGFTYRYEDYNIDSFNLEGLKPYLPSTLLLVANDNDYQADVFGIRVLLEF